MASHIWRELGRTMNEWNRCRLCPHSGLQKHSGQNRPQAPSSPPYCRSCQSSFIFRALDFCHRASVPNDSGRLKNPEALRFPLPFFHRGRPHFFNFPEQLIFHLRDLVFQDQDLLEDVPPNFIRGFAHRFLLSLHCRQHPALLSVHVLDGFLQLHAVSSQVLFKAANRPANATTLPLLFLMKTNLLNPPPSHANLSRLTALASNTPTSGAISRNKGASDNRPWNNVVGLIGCVTNPVIGLVPTSCWAGALSLSSSHGLTTLTNRRGMPTNVAHDDEDRRR